MFRSDGGAATVDGEAEMNSGELGLEKIIIDTDPDDSMAIFMAFQSPQLEVLGLTTIFGNVTTEDATRHALLLCEIAGCPGLPVAEGTPEPLKIYGDPEAADVVFTSGADIIVVGINITTQVKMTDADLDELRQSEGRHAQFISNMCKVYGDWHVKSDGVQGIFLHGPVSFVALVQPDLFTYKKGVVRVETQGICLGHTLMDQGLKTWNSSNPWSGYSPVSVAWTVNTDEVLNYVKQLLMKP